MGHFFGPQGAPHGMLSAWHADSFPAVIVRGDTMLVNAALLWVRLPRGTDRQVLAMNGLDPAWRGDYVARINFDEADAVDQSRTAETNMKTYNLAANPYSLILAEAEIKYRLNQAIVGAGTTLTFRLYYGANLIKTWINNHAWNFGANLDYTAGFVFKCSAAFAAGGLIRLTQQNNLGADNPNFTITQNSLRVYGVV
jgi:hypothetical protein